MKDKDKLLLEDAGVAVVDYGVTIADEIVSHIPGLSLAWGLSKALYGAGLRLRQKRALEWIEMVRDNPSIFTENVLNDDKFQDGFTYALEKYIVERNEEKRLIFRNIFLGFAEVENKEKFALEKFVHTLSQLSEIDIQVLKDVKVDEQGKNYQIYGGNFNRIENIYNLIGQDLLLDITGDRVGHNAQNAPFVKASFFGKKFISYLIEPNAN